jgi:hypothetical protein
MVAPLCFDDGSRAVVRGREVIPGGTSDGC